MFDIDALQRTVLRSHAGGSPLDGPVTRTYDIFAPGRGEILAEVQDATQEDTDRVVEAAHARVHGWADLSTPERQRRLMAFADGVLAAADELARIDAINGGHPVRWTRFGAVKGAETLKYFAGIALEAGGRTIPATPDHLHLSVREPFGIVGVITAYNHPTMFATARTAAALVAGNVVVVKPAEQTPISALRLAQIADEHLGPGTFNVLTGRSDAGRALVMHRRVRRINFTGSTSTALRIQADAAASGHLKRLGFQLSGKNPLIVMPDVPVDEAADAAVEGMNLFKVMGQSCGSTSIAFVHERMVRRFEAAVADRLEAIRPGNPEDETTEVGALVTAEHRDRVASIVDAARADGARLLVGGHPPTDPDLRGGFYYLPTALGGVDESMAIYRQEVFGPALSVVPWDDESALLESVNASDFGLTASIYTHDLDTALRMARAVEAGYVWVNDVEKRWIGVPFGGFKDSGTSTEFSVEELHANTQLKAINIRLR